MLRSRRWLLPPRIRGLSAWPLSLRAPAVHRRRQVQRAPKQAPWQFNHKQSNGPKPFIVPFQYRLFRYCGAAFSTSVIDLCQYALRRNKPVHPSFRIHGTSEQKGQRRYSRTVVRVFSASDRRHAFARGHHDGILFRADIEDLLRHTGLQLNRGPQWLL